MYRIGFPRKVFLKPYMYGKILKTFIALFVLLFCSLPFKKLSAIMKNAKLLHD